MTTLRDRLADQNERFAPSEIYALFEELAEQYGYYRSNQLPAKELRIETISMTVKGYEHLGVIVVRPRTVGDSMTTIPKLVDKILGDDFNPSQNTAFNANLIALAQCVIVSPPGFVDTLLESTNDEDLRFFLAFAQEYAEWMQGRTEEAAKKKSGRISGTESASTSDTNETSSSPTPAG